MPIKCHWQIDWTPTFPCIFFPPALINLLEKKPTYWTRGLREWLLFLSVEMWKTLEPEPLDPTKTSFKLRCIATAKKDGHLYVHIYTAVKRWSHFSEMWTKTVAEVEPFLCNGDEMMWKVYSTAGANYLLPNILWQVVQHSSVVLGISIPSSDFLLIH